MMKRYEAWLDQYLSEQMQHHPEVIYELFEDNAEYWYGPYFTPRKGVEEIYKHHKNALSHQENLVYKYEILAETLEFSLAWFSLELDDLQPGEPNRYEGIFMIYLTSDGKCSLFKEWYNFKLEKV